ncbi:MAG TPA: hypothetical protein VHA34_05230, partial [Actinomycetes bacterium]|nr:hypothetical protein [Actinomycetes bacterium]
MQPLSRGAALRRPCTEFSPAVVLALLGLVLTTALATLSLAVARPPTRPPAAAAPASLPLVFEPAGDTGFVSRGPGWSLALSPSEAVLGVPGGRFSLRPAGPSANPSA